MTNFEKRFETYYTTLLEEKGIDLEGAISLHGHFGYTYADLLGFILNRMQEDDQRKVWLQLRRLDFQNRDVTHFLAYLAQGVCDHLLA